MNRNDLKYWKKQESPLFKDLEWNFPEQKSGIINIIGGNSMSFSSEVKITEFLLQRYPIENVNLILPDSLRKKLPPLPNIIFTPSSDSGSFKKSIELASALNSKTEPCFNLFLGDFSKNSETSVAIIDLLKKTETPTLLARDSIDILSSDAEEILEKGNLTLVASLIQLQKLFRSVYYPKMILLSSPIIPIIETLHKFTLSYPVSILTLHEGILITASNGKIITTDLKKTEYSPISYQDGRLAAKISAYLLYNQKKPLESINAALF